MTDNATPKRRTRPTYSRPTKYPAGISIMTTTEQRAAVDTLIDADGSLAEVVRELIDDGLALRAALAEYDGLREDITRLARDGATDFSGAIGTMLAFAERESRRRLERDGRIAAEFLASLAKSGIDVDGVTAGGIDVRIE